MAFYNPEKIRFRILQSVKSMSGHWYKNIQHIGNGANASTYLVKATTGQNIGVLFALKIFTNIGKKKRRERFIGEVNFLQQCDHPAIMKVFDQGIFKVDSDGKSTKEFPFVIAEYLPNTMRSIIEQKLITNIKKTTYAIQLLSALKYLSTQSPKVIHRDIKPANIFIKGDSCALGDFGLMKFEEKNSFDDFDFFLESTKPGMPYRYRTPDLISFSKKEADLTTKSDIFQLGIVLVELFTGINPIKTPKTLLDPLIVERNWHVTGKYGSDIAGILLDMLKIDSHKRPEIDTIIARLQKLFWEMVKSNHSMDGFAL